MGGADQGPISLSSHVFFGVARFVSNMRASNEHRPLFSTLYGSCVRVARARETNRATPFLQTGRGARTVGHPTREQDPLALLPILDRPLDLAAGFAGSDGLPAVVLLLALRETDLDLGMAALGEIDAEGHEREPLLLGLADQFVDFLPMQQQFSGPGRILVHDVPVTVGADVAMVQKDFVVVYGGVTILEVHTAFTQGFHFRPLKHDAGFKLLFDEIIVVGLPIGRHYFLLIV